MNKLVWKMPGRYEMVEEPGSMEVMEEDVYHPDQSVRDNHSSVRSLEPIVAGPISLKTIFYDSRWNPNQRKCCLGIMLVVSATCLAILIALFVGLGRVLHYINVMEELREHGLHMVPDLEMMPEGTTAFWYSKDHPNKLAPYYINEINTTIIAMGKQLEEAKSVLADCQGPTNPPDDKLCNFDIKTILAPCLENNFGFDKGAPCIMFQFRKNKDWVPKFRPQTPTKLKLSCVAARGGVKVSSDEDFQYYPKDGFPLYLIQKKKVDSFEQIDATVMVKMLKLGEQSSLTIECFLAKENLTNLEDFHGITGIKFEYDNSAKEAGAVVDVEP